MTLQEHLFTVARRIGKQPSAGVLFCLTNRLLPLEIIAREPGLVAFHHPKPVIDPHVLIVPTRPVSSITTARLSAHSMAALIWEMTELARILIPNLPASDTWNMVINGGSRQDVGQMHGHLMHTSAPAGAGFGEVNDPSVDMVPWSELLREVQEADTHPGVGYSLEILWRQTDSPRARITCTSPP